MSQFYDDLEEDMKDPEFVSQFNKVTNEIREYIRRATTCEDAESGMCYPEYCECVEGKLIE